MNSKSHLSVEQIERVLAGSPEEPLQEHLDRCETCSAEVERLREVFGDLRTSLVETAHSEWKFAVIRERKGWTRRSAPLLAWAGAAALLAAGLMIPFSPLAHLRHGETVAARPTPPADVTLSDEALLNDVQKDLSTSIPEPLEPLAGTQTTTGKNQAQGTISQ